MWYAIDLREEGGLRIFSYWRDYRKYPYLFCKDFVAGCHLFFFLLIFVMHSFSHIHARHSSIAIHPLIAWSPVEKTSWVLSRDMNSGLPHRRPTHYQLSRAASWNWAIPHPDWATLHPWNSYCEVLFSIGDIVQVPQLEYVYNIAATELVMRVAKHIFTSYLQVLLSNTVDKKIVPVVNVCGTVPCTLRQRAVPQTLYPGTLYSTVGSSVFLD